MGYATAAYKLYVQCVRLEQRDEQRREDGHPVTPCKEQKCSKRSFDGQVRKWRRQLHEWDEGGRMYVAYGGAGGDSVRREDGEGRVELTVDERSSGSVPDYVGEVVDEQENDEDGIDEDEDDWRESIVRMAGALPD